MSSGRKAKSYNKEESIIYKENMFYLINKTTNEVKAENEHKSRLRKLQKTLSDKENYKVSKVANTIEKKKSRKINMNDVTDFEEVQGVRKKLTDYRCMTPLIKSKVGLIKFLTKTKVKTYLIKQHQEGYYYAFYD